MTDNEIIKAFDCCGGDGCANCPARPFTDCVDRIMDEASRIINRQKAEIERLQECPKCVYAMVGEEAVDEATAAKAWERANVGADNA